MNKIENLSQEYVAPVVEVLEIQVEKGFATSANLPEWDVE